jgi:hypothetical protein
MTARWAALVLAGGMLLLSSVATFAQGPVRSETLYAGGYQLRVDLYADPPFTGRQYDFDVLVTADRPADVRGVDVTAAAVPDAGTNATELPATITPVRSDPGGFKGYVTMGVRGRWQLHFVVSGLLGTNTVNLPLDVAAPTEIPLWLAWAIALSPLLGLLAFAQGQRAYLRRLQTVPAT